MPGTDHAADVLEALADGASTTPAAETQESSVSADDYREVVDRAVAARGDIDAAARFCDEIGLDRLDRAIEQAEGELSRRAEQGREARAAFERYRDAAAGNHFHRARDTSLGGAGVRHDK